jgi:hypothetical protein
MTQQTQILAFLSSGRVLTPLDALRRFGCLRLAARALDLRHAGHDVRCRLVVVGPHRKRVGLYWLATP